MNWDLISSAIIKRGIHHWIEHGTTSTLNKAHRKILRYKYEDSFSNQIIDRDSVIDIGDSSDNVWFGKQESKFVISDLPQIYKISSTDGLTGQYKPKQRYLSEVPNCHVVGPSAVGIWDKKNIILDTASGNAKKFRSRFFDFFPVNLCQHIKFGSLDKQTTNSISGPVLPLVPYQDQYYYHWLLEQLPKLRLLEQYTDKTGKKPNLLIPSNPPAFITESLGLLGYSTDQLIEWKGGIVAIDSLLVTDHRSYSPHREFYTPSRTDCEWVRDCLVDQIEQSSDISPLRRTYISRQEAVRGRSVINFSELENWLNTHNFRINMFEQHPFHIQVQMASQSEIIMGPVGAGMSNILFADNPLVVELTLNGWTLPFYFLSEILGHEFKLCVCDVDKEDSLYVDIGALENRIQSNKL